jgi:Mitochondrial genome maintenance MGM101
MSTQTWRVGRRWEEQRCAFSNSTMSRRIIQVLYNASARPIPRIHSSRSLPSLGWARWAPPTVFCSPPVPARKASTERDFDIDEDIPLLPPSPPKAPSPSPNPFPESSLDVPATGTDWSRSYSGLSTERFPKEVAEILMAPVDPLNVEIKPGPYKSHNACLWFSVDQHISQMDLSTFRKLNIVVS